MQVRSYGNVGPPVILLHGGPGAPGSMAPVGRALGETFRVLEPFQRSSDKDNDKDQPPLTVARHIADLDELIDSRHSMAPPALVGHSWGAMLALAYAAAHPGSVRALALISCGTFNAASRARMKFLLDQRFTPQLRRQMEQLRAGFPDPNQRLKAVGDFLLPLYSFDLVTTNTETGGCDARAHDETWHDMLHLQESGVYPAALAAIKVPVLMLHGAADPHPGTMIRDSLLPYLPQLEYREWVHCGHYPWLERAVRGEFFALLRDWLQQPHRG